VKEIKLDKTNRIQVLQEALHVLNEGGVIIYPTETSYGLGCDFYNKKAMAKIYKIKKRDQGKPLPVIVPDIITASYLVNFDDNSRRLALSHWPGPLTLVLPFKYCKWQGHCDDFLALRVSSHPFASELARNFGKPIVSTSANFQGAGNIYSGKKIKALFKGQAQADLFINAGDLPETPPSTIIKFNGKPEILRKGSLKINF